ncbi:MAG: glycosyltransferase family 4 protein [Cellvibrionaceae bacterium]|nr:glycosyltransferase family 4 protein [Cellvibrionaceae bacterium]
MNAPQKKQFFPALQPLQSPLKIALLGYRSDPHVGGQGIYLYYLSRALHQLGHMIDVYSGPPYPKLAAGVNLIKVPSLDLYASEDHVRALRWQHLRSFTDTWEWFSMLTGGFPEPYTFGRRVLKRLKLGDYDLVHDNQSLCFGLLELQRAGVPVVSTIHHPIHRDLQQALLCAENWRHKLLIKRWYSFLSMQQEVAAKLKHVVTVSRQSQLDIEHFFKRHRSRTKLVANGIDTHIFKPLPTVVRKTNQLITTASADQPLKGLPILLDSFAELKADLPSLKLIIIGKLRSDGAAQKQIERLGLAPHIELFSGISTAALVKLYAESTLAVVPSLYEGFGLPLGEAMSCGLPVISSDGGALPEVIGKAGITVPAGNSAALAQGIKTLLQQPHKRQQLGSAARHRILEKFCWRQVARQLTAYYQQILSQHVDP